MIDTVCKRYHSFLAHFSLYILHARRPEPECSGWGQVTAAPRSISARLLAVLPCNNNIQILTTMSIFISLRENCPSTKASPLGSMVRKDLYAFDASTPYHLKTTNCIGLGPPNPDL